MPDEPAPASSPEFTRLWNEWLKTNEGKRYEAGWGDYENRDRAERGRRWVHERMIERLEAEVERLTAERDTARRQVIGTAIRLRALAARYMTEDGDPGELGFNTWGWQTIAKCLREVAASLPSSEDKPDAAR